MVTHTQAVRLAQRYGSVGAPDSVECRRRLQTSVGLALVFHMIMVIAFVGWAHRTPQPPARERTYVALELNQYLVVPPVPSRIPVVVPPKLPPPPSSGPRTVPINTPANPANSQLDPPRVKLTVVPMVPPPVLPLPKPVPVSVSPIKIPEDDPSIPATSPQEPPVPQKINIAPYRLELLKRLAQNWRPSAGTD